MTIRYTHEAAEFDLDELWAILRETYWSPGIRREVVARAVSNSLVIAAMDGPKLAGFARMVTDRATFGWICDVIVIPAYRRQGIATRMVRQLIEHPDLATLRRFALATRDASAVYEPLGFAFAPPNRWMEKRLDPARWQDRASDSSVPGGGV